MVLNRREFLISAAAGIGACVLPGQIWADAGTAGGHARLSIHPESKLTSIPAGFAGLSYEANQLARTDLFNKSITALIEYFRRLGRRGVLRIGGNSSEFTVWNPASDAALSDIKLPYNPDKTH